MTLNALQNFRDLEVAKLMDFYTGDSIMYRLEIKDDDGNPVDLQGQILWVTFKKKSSSDYDLQLRYSLPASNSYYEQGIAYIYIPYNKTELLTKGSYEYDIQLIYSTVDDDFVVTLVKDSVYVHDDVTKKDS